MSHSGVLFENSQSKLSALLEDSQSSEKVDGDVEMSTSRRSDGSTQSALASDVSNRTCRLRFVLMIAGLVLVTVLVFGSSFAWRNAFGGVFACMAMYITTAMFTMMIGPKFFRTNLQSISEKYLSMDTASNLSHHGISGNVVLVANTAFGVYCIATSLSISADDFYVGNPDKYWADSTVAIWCSVTPVLQLIIGVFLVINTIEPIFKILRWSVPVQVLFITAQVYWMAQNFDEQHGVIRTAGIMATQQLCFYLGVYLGWQLLDGHKIYYDEVSQLKVMLLDQRVEKLAEEKERLDFDRRVALKQSRKTQERLARLEEELESYEETSVTRNRDETSMRSCEPPPPDNMPDDDIHSEPQVTDLEALNEQPIVTEDIPHTLSDLGKAQSSAGWSTISALINKERAMMREMAAEEVIEPAPATQLIETPLQPTAGAGLVDQVHADGTRHVLVPEHAILPLLLFYYLVVVVLVAPPRRAVLEDMFACMYEHHNMSIASVSFTCDDALY